MSFSHRFRSPGHPSPECSSSRAFLLAFLACGSLLGATPSSAAETRCTSRHYRLEAQLDPAVSRLQATAELTLDCPAGAAAPTLALHPELTILSLTREGKPLRWHRLKSAPPAEGEAANSLQPAIYELPDLQARDGDVLVLRYAGALRQDVQAGEKRGEIHNFAMHAHIAPEGIYLEPEGYWYPQPETAEADTAGTQELALATFELRARQVPGMLLVASGDRQGALERHAPPAESATAWDSWRSPFPLPGMALAGGPHQAWQRQVGNVMVSIHVDADSASFAEPMLDAAAHYLELYQPLLGPYPYRELTVVENFFSSGFAFPGFTLLAREVVRMGPHGLRPGYLDHELLHNWWGNGVFVSELDGNWCEALASYCANYMRPVLEGDAGAARKHRRDIVEQLSRLTAEQNKPLDTFSRPHGASRFIGYQKGSMVFAQLAREIGQEAMWRTLARFFREQRGKAAGWQQIQQAAEAESGRRLEAFFRYWVRGQELPEVTVENARYTAAKAGTGGALELEVRYQHGGELPMRLPVRLAPAGEGASPGPLEVELRPGSGSQEVHLATSTPPQSLELDPDYLTLRRLPPQLLMPDLSGITNERPLNLVRAAGDDAAYDSLAEDVRKRYEQGGEVHELAAGELRPQQLHHGHALVLGRAARVPAVAELLKGSPVALTEHGFAVRGQSYEQPGQALLVCLRNPRDAGAVICLYLGNSPEALTRSYLVPFYGGNSLLVFDGGSPVLREDFELAERVPVRAAAP